MLFALWSPKGGSGTSTVVAACALARGRAADTRVADLAGDLPAVLGLAADPPTGLADWLAAGPDAPTDALDRLAVEVRPGLALLPRGAPPVAGEPTPEGAAGAALGVTLRDDPVPTFLDAGAGHEPAHQAALAVADVTLVVVRGCYLSLRRAVAAPALSSTHGVVLVDEPGRTLGAGDVADVLGRPVVARVPVRVSIARAVDAGVLATRLPDAVSRPAREVLRACGLPPGSKRDAAA